MSQLIDYTLLLLILGMPQQSFLNLLLNPLVLGIGLAIIVIIVIAVVAKRK